MLDLKTQLGDYLDHVVERVDVEDVLEQRTGLEPVRPIVPRKAPFRVPRWFYGVAAAVIVLLLIGSVVLLSGPSTPPPADTPTTTVEVTPTTVEVTPTTEAPITTDTSVATTTTLAAAPVVPPGEGPRLEFVQVESPGDQPLVEGVWFEGAFYALSGEAETELFRSTDGLGWDLVTGFPGGTGRDHRLQTDGDRLVSVVVPRDARGDCNGSFIEVSTSTNGVDWVSSEIEMPVPGGSSGACEYFEGVVTAFAVGPKGMVVASHISVYFEGDEFANSLVDPDAGIHVDVVGFDLDRGVMIVQFLDENNDMEPIGDLREVGLNESGFSRRFASILDFMGNDPSWEPPLDRFIALARRGGASVSLGAAWFSTDGVTWQAVDGTGPLDLPVGQLRGSTFSAIAATPDGFVATASAALPGVLETAPRKSIWESTNGTVWTEPPDLITGQGVDGGEHISLSLDRWNGELVEVSPHPGEVDGQIDRQVWTLAEPSQRLFSDIPMHDMNLVLSEHGLIGTTDDWRPGTIEVLLSVDGTSWSRWEPPEFGPGPARAWIVGVGDDFVVIQVWENDNPGSYTLWVATLP